MSSSKPFPTWLLQTKRGSEKSSSHKYKKVSPTIKSRDQIELEILKKKYGWTNGSYELLLEKMTKNDEKLINTLFKAQQHHMKLKSQRAQSQIINGPPRTSIFEKVQNVKDPTEKKEKAAKAAKAEYGTCPAKKMDGKTCGAKLKSGKSFCGHHDPDKKKKK
jgi:hypothetical protein